MTESNDSLRSISWKRFLRAPDGELLRELYEPALRRAVRYDRCCAYFSSRVLAAAARGFGGLIENLLAMGDAAPKPAVRLIVNEQLERQDLKALLATGNTATLEAKLLKRLKSPADAVERNRLEMLTWLVKSGLLDVRVGVMRHTGGVLHSKYGIITDAHGDSIAFMGSDNETAEAISSNYEELTVEPSWQDPEFAGYYRERFDALWDDRDDCVLTLPLPEAVRLKLIQLAPDRPPKEVAHDKRSLAAAMLWKYLAVAPYLPNGEQACDEGVLVELWPHQKRVVEDTACAFPAGRLLCDEVGMGKTLEAIAVLRRLLCGRGVKRALLLVPAGLLQQWQGELREKGGLLVPVWDGGSLRHPDGSRQPVPAADALAGNDLLILSREWARLDDNRPILLSAPRWDLVLMDESHAARRAAGDSSFNSGNLLLKLLRELQLRRRTRGILLLSATPMQIHAWEPWDLLAVAGVGGEWMVDFADVEGYYQGVAELQSGQKPGKETARLIGRLVAQDREFPPYPCGTSDGDAASVASRLWSAVGDGRMKCAEWLRKGSPLGRRMHRNTRDTLRRYHDEGWLATAPPTREVKDVVYGLQPGERECYNAVERYINMRYQQLEKEKKGKGFLMTVYHRRAASSPYALRCSLERRRDALDKVIRGVTDDTALDEDIEQVDMRDLSDAGIEEGVSPALPSNEAAARDEKKHVAELLERLSELGPTDSKLEKFHEVLDSISADGRAVLVFSEYKDTVEYLRDKLRLRYDTTVACYTGSGGEVWDGSEWVEVPKAEITQRLDAGSIKVLVCTDAASEGLNLQAAGALINYDLPWNPARVEQRIGRIDRIGQKHPVLPVRNLFLEDSVDMRVYRVLRERCDLFQHFVGRMQPVLAAARDILRGLPSRDEVPDILRRLEEEADKVERDAVTASIYRDADAERVCTPNPTATRKDLETALEWLAQVDGSVKAAPVRGQKKWRIKGIGKGAVDLTMDRDTLERDGKVRPLTLGCDEVAQVAEKLRVPDNAVPLVVGESECGAYRCVEARWVGPATAAGKRGGGKRAIPVESAAQLIGLIGRWDGTPPSPAELTAAQREAFKAARRRLERQVAKDREQEEADVSAQVAAARRRLLRELARTLRCVDTGKDLAMLFDAELKRETSEEGRYHRALRRLGGSPEFTAEDAQEATLFVDSLKPAEKQARVNLGSEIEAALNDPRWLAAGSR